MAVLTRDDKLENGITGEWLARVAGTIYDRVTGNEPDGEDDPGMLRAVNLIHSYDLSSETEPVTVTADEMAKLCFVAHCSAWGMDEREQDEVFYNEVVRKAWQAIVRWAMYAVQCDSEAEAAGAAETFIERFKKEKADVSN